MSIINIAAYKFVALNQLATLQQALKVKASQCALKGTILLSEEGINLMLAGERQDIDAFTTFLASYPAFQDLIYKESVSATRPFKRLLVRIKKEIITMRCPQIQPEKFTAPHLSPEEFQQWYRDNKEMLVLDTRNTFEVNYGTFAHAEHLALTSFGEFPQALDQLPADAKEKPVVTFCTGGIRCEKAAALMLEKGFKEVYQLDGGILNYFEKCGTDYFEGQCFVFDERVAIDGVQSE